MKGKKKGVILSGEYVSLTDAFQEHVNCHFKFQMCGIEKRPRHKHLK